MLSGIYKMENRVNGDFYIGSAINLYARKHVHFSLLCRNKHPNLHLQRAWNKYGRDNFEFKTLLFCDKLNNLLYEQRCLDILKPAYNNSPTANSNLGTKYNINLKSRMKGGLTRKGIPKPKSYSEKLSKRMIGNKLGLGRKKSKEELEKLSERMQGNTIWLGRHHIEETKRKISIANKGKVVSKETRQKMSDSRKAYFARLKAKKEGRILCLKL